MRLGAIERNQPASEVQSFDVRVGIHIDKAQGQGRAELTYGKGN